jgi:hypothetical protein
MRYFASTPKSIWATKVNFVDDNNVLVGYDFAGNCCEDFGWYIHDKVGRTNGEDPIFSDSIDQTALNESLKDWTFDTTFFDELSNGDGYVQENFAVFRLVNGDNELFLHLYNSHNGYYGHGFDFSVDEKIIKTGVL